MKTGRQGALAGSGESVRQVGPVLLHRDLQRITLVLADRVERSTAHLGAVAGVACEDDSHRPLVRVEVLAIGALGAQIQDDGRALRGRLLVGVGTVGRH